ncbi:hypothetical protein M8C21_026008, partial [Ambrosia artemisiifolia]
YKEQLLAHTIITTSQLTMALKSLIILLLFFLVLALLSAASILEDEAEALKQFKNSITDDPSGALLDWNADSNHHCNWTGIQCHNITKRVIAISIQQTYLKGHISSFLGNLSSLQLLDLSYNSFTGSIPFQLGYCTQLSTIILYTNSLSGPIPSELGKLQNLQILDLGNNSITGIIPETLCDCTSLLELHLDSNKLNGTIPDRIGDLMEMVQAIDISNNNLSGGIPVAFQNCRNLQSLDLSGNQLSGSVSDELFPTLNLLSNINFSRNQLEGKIPESMANLTSLTSVDLSHNKFNGTIPENFANILALKHLNLSFNQLEGRVPNTGIFKNSSAIGLHGNPSLCVTNDTKSCALSTQSNHSHQISRKAVLILAILGSLALLLVLFLGILCYRHVRKPKVKESEDPEPKYTRGVTLKRFDRKELEDATDGFNEANTLGTSSLSTVYKGTLADGRMIAVKNLNFIEFSVEADKSFNKEMNTLAKLRHRNLVKVLGYAWESGKLKALVLEYMENGNLDKVIHDHVIDRSRWDLSERVDVLVSVSRGLVYLHCGYDFPIVHCDLKPSNILLDEKWDAHVSDFGTARILGVHPQDGSSVSSASAFQGTIGYLAPGNASPALSFILSIFVIIMELMTRKRPTGLTEEDGIQMTLPQLIEQALSKGMNDLIEVVDPDLASDFSTKHGVVEEILQLAVCCTRTDPDDRPDMNKILSSLTKISKKVSVGFERGEVEEEDIAVEVSLINIKIMKFSLKGERKASDTKGIPTQKQVFYGKSKKNILISRAVSFCCKLYNKALNLAQGQKVTVHACMNPDACVLEYKDSFFAHTIITTSQLTMALKSLTLLTFLVLAVLSAASILEEEAEALKQFKNSITDDPTGQVPDKIFDLKQLTELYMMNNKFEGSVLNSVSKLEMLSRLDLSGNRFNGSIGESLTKLNRLISIDLSHNFFTGLISRPVISSMKNMQIYLNISNNFLTGTIPNEFGKMEMVQAIDISNNNLSGGIPVAFQNCRNLQSLDLSGNQLSGSVSDEIFPTLNLLSNINFSRNQLEGSIPERMGNLTLLTSVDLSQNKFNGTIPENLGNNLALKHLNLSFNHLEGRVPNTGIFKNSNAVGLLGNPFLCVTNDTKLCNFSSRPNHSNTIFRKSVLIPAILGSLGLLIVLYFGVVCYRRVRKPIIKEPEDPEPEYTRGVTLKRFNRKELEDATDRFNESNILGTSSLSTVYKGTLADGRVIAVKNLNFAEFSAESDKSFNKEMNTLVKLRHRNLVKVLGYAWESGKLKAVVLEYMENGNLDTAIHDSGINRSRWGLSERVDVLVSVSKGLVYLHCGYDFPIVHCDLKPSNILLDESWDVHVSDFGTARILGVQHQDESSLSSSSAAFEGTIGYLAPEFAYMRKVTTKVDVYSFGVIIMELITRKRPTGLTEEDGIQMTLPQLIEQALSKGMNEVIEVVDPDLASDFSTKHGVVEEILQLAVCCTRADPDDRPDMNEVLSSLTKIITVVGQTAQSQTFGFDGLPKAKNV